MIRPLLTTLLLTLVATASISSPTQAGVFFLDQFNYADGQLTDSPVGGVPGDNVSGGQWTAHSGDTFDDNVAVIGQQAQLLNSGSEDVNRATNVSMGAGETWYYAADFSVNFTGADGDPINNDYFMHFKDDGFGFRGRVYLDDANAEGNDYTLGFSASSGGQAAAWDSDLAFGESNILVVSYDYDTGESKLWVNPIDESSPSLSDTAGEMTVLNALALRQDFLGGDANNEILVNAVSAGDDFDEVLAVIVPEPTSSCLVLMAVFGLAFRRRRTS